MQELWQPTQETFYENDKFYNVNGGRVGYGVAR